WTRGVASAHVAFRTFILRRRPGCKFSQLNSPPRLFPCLRFAVHLAMPNAKLGAKVDRYSFLVRILDSLLHTGLARRTNIAITLIDPFPSVASGLPALNSGHPGDAGGMVGDCIVANDGVRQKTSIFGHCDSFLISYAFTHFPESGRYRS